MKAKMPTWQKDKEGKITNASKITKLVKKHKQSKKTKQGKNKLELCISTGTHSSFNLYLL